LNQVGDACDAQGELTKEPVQKLLQQYLAAYATFVERVNK
jgi:chromate reductase